MNVFTLNIRKDLHGDSNMQLFWKQHVITKSGLNKTLYWMSNACIGTLYITGMYLIALALWASFVDLVTSEHISWGRLCIIEIKFNIGVISMVTFVLL
jgi:hypothetical protein